VDLNASTGWDFINEGGAKKPKWGFISTKPGGWARGRVGGCVLSATVLMG
jgi:hypothetical protein